MFKPKEAKAFLSRYFSVVTDLEFDEDDALKMIKNSALFYRDRFYDANWAVSRQLQQDWYDRLQENRDPYAVYRDPRYFIDTWVCFQLYSYKLVQLLKKPLMVEERCSAAELFDVDEVGVIADLGCGLGLTTAYLADMFPRAEVFGTNIPDTDSFKFCESLADEHGFAMAGATAARDLPEMHQHGLIFMSEYLEHIADAPDHISELANEVVPRFFCMVNSFNTRSIGHFEQYEHDGSLIPAKSASRVIGKILRNAGYKKLKTKYWNGRPTVWQLDA